MKYKKIFFGMTTIAFMSGLAVGALFAPHKGAVTRRRMRNKLVDAKDSAQEALEYKRSEMGL